MRWRWPILAVVFAGTFAATYALWPAPGVGMALIVAAVVSLIVGLGWRDIRAGRRARDREYMADHAYHGALGAAYVVGSYDSPVDCSGASSGFGGDCGAGGV